MAGRNPPNGFYAYNPPSASRPLPTTSQPQPPPLLSQGTPPVFAYDYNYYSASAASSYHGTNNPGSAGGDIPGMNEVPKAEEDAMWTCDACDMSLMSERALKSHKKSHVKCVECSFEGVPKIVKAHYQASHGKFSRSGFKTVTVAIPGCRVQRFRICVGNRPEDIQRWIADRKKRFPRQMESPGICGREDQAITAPTEDKGGLSSLLAGYGSSASEAEIIQEAERGKEETSAKRIAESPTHNPGMEVVKDASESMAQLARPRMCRYFMRKGACMNGDACRFRHEVRSANKQSGRNTRKRNRGQSSSNNTLLRKLLTNDMERESRLALQLLRYIVDSSYFDEENVAAARSSLSG